MTRVLVTGARGKTGVALAGLLAERRDVEVRGGSADPGSIRLDGVAPVGFAWDEPSGWSSALEDVDAVYLVRPDRPDAPELVAAFLAAMASRTRVVLLSERSADGVGPGVAGWASRVERAVRADGEVTGRTWTVLRPGWFMQVLTDHRFFHDDITGGGSLPFASGGAAMAWIDAGDIAAVAARALLDDDLAGQVLELTGPEPVSLPRTAELLSAALGHPVAHREVTIEEAVAGTEGFERELTALTFDRVRAGVFSEVTDTVERVTGRPARSLQELIATAFGGMRPPARCTAAGHPGRDRSSRQVSR